MRWSRDGGAIGSVMGTAVVRSAIAAVIVIAIAWVGGIAATAPAGERGRPAQAPDQALIAFQGTRWASNLTSATSAIYVVRADGSGQRRLTGQGDHEDSAPTWSPDGRRIAFGRRTGVGWRLQVMAADGSGRRVITRRQALADAPAWSPDGRSIAFERLPARLPATGSTSQQVFVVGSAGGSLRALTRDDRFRGGAGQPAWRPDGRRIAFWGRTSLAGKAPPDVWVVRPDGSGARRLIGDATDPAWSPDGARLAFSRDGDIFTATATGADVRRLTRTRAGDTDPSWAADGARIAFSTMHRRTNQARDDRRLSVINADGSGHREITDGDPLFWAGAPSWRP
jgi:Tol biopolymer transport system component